MVSSAQLTISTDAVALNEASDAGRRLLIRNTSANDADLGNSDVTAGNGFVLTQNDIITVDLVPGDVLYAIRSGGSDTTLSVLRT